MSFCLVIPHIDKVNENDSNKIAIYQTRYDVDV